MIGSARSLSLEITTAASIFFSKQVDQQVGRDVDVRALLLSVCDGDHERHIWVVDKGAGLDHDRPGRVDQLGTPLAIRDGQGRVLTLLV